MKTILNRFIKFGSVNCINWTNFFDFLKKNDFSRFWLKIFYQKNKIVSKWEKVSFDGLFELAIVDLVGIEF